MKWSKLDFVMTEGVATADAMDDEAEDLAIWTKEEWLRRFREIWRSPEDMKSRLNDTFQRYFDINTSLFPTADRCSSSSDSSSDTERIPRFLFLCAEQQRSQPFVLETIKFFESLLDSSSDQCCSVSVDEEQRTNLFNYFSKFPTAFETAPKTVELFQFVDRKEQLRNEINMLLEKVREIWTVMKLFLRLCVS